MPALLLSPVALTLLRIGAIAAVAAIAARRGGTGAPRPALREAALDDLPEGIDLGADRCPDGLRTDGAVRWSRTLRLGRRGPGVALDIAALGRVRVRRA